LKIQRKLFFALAIFSALISSQRAIAQKSYRIGALVAGDQFLPAVEGFKKKMMELGYQEGKNISYDLQNSEGDPETLKNLSKKLVEKNPDVIVTSSTTATVPLAKLTEGTNLPVVFLSAGNPLAFVKSYASSGNNLTGISNSSIDLTEKRLELLKELDPRVKRLISLYDTQQVSYEPIRRGVQEAAARLGLGVVEVTVSSKEDLNAKLGSLNRKMGDAIFVSPQALIAAAMKEIVRQSIKERLPTIVPTFDDVKSGGLATYGADYYSLGQQGAVLVDKILRGARPSDLPIELPRKLYLVINMKAAKAIGLKISKEILLRSDEVIE
jgi:putative ABC transport system substrate-binding protein